MLESLLKHGDKPLQSSEPVREVVLHPHHIDDLALWKAFRAGDEKAFIAIFDRFAKPMYNYGYKIVGDAELVKDGVQELFIEIWQSRARLKDTDSIKFYLLKSLRRKLIRSKAKSENRLFGRLFMHDHKEVTPSQEFIMITEQMSLERRQKVMAMLKKLTKRQHEAIFLRFFEELNCDQIAAVMQVTKQGVYNLIHNALDELKKCRKD